jgi:hypothetical protein
MFRSPETLPSVARATREVQVVVVPAALVGALLP